jgi:hypothetical protein
LQRQPLSQPPEVRGPPRRGRGGGAGGITPLQGTPACAWADSAYSGERFSDLLNLGGFEYLIHAQGARNHPLSDAAKELNRVKSSIRACVEHVIGFMTMSMGGKLTRKIGLERSQAWWGLKNLTFNFRRYLHCSVRMAAVK